MRRHVNLVYSAALRQVGGDAHLAQDVAQTVFTDLARKAGSLVCRESLTGWLYTSAHFAATKMVRTENRRREREEKFMREPTNGTVADASRAGALAEAGWEKIRPALDDVMHELKESDREAILLRYFENRQFAEVGAKLGLNENAARMRVERALEKLRAVFAKRGITAATALASVISANAVQVAPAGLATTLATTSIATAGAGTFTLLKFMTATQFKLGISALVVAGAATAMVVQHQTQTRLRGESESLRRQIAELQMDNQNLSNRLAEIGQTKSLTDEQFNELLRLRGEVGLLKDKADALNKENRAMRTELESRFATSSHTNLAASLEIHIKSRFVFLPKGVLTGLQSALGLQTSANNSFTGIMNDDSFTNLLVQLSKRQGVEILGAPEVTSSSGRQFQMRATQIISVVTNMELLETNGTRSIIPQTEMVETGPILDATPRILSDNYTIALPVIASVTDFLGYQPSTNSVPAYASNGEEVDLPEVLPQFRERQATASVNLWDGQTLILKLSDKQVPGDTMLQSMTGEKVKIRQGDTLVFVTASIVDTQGQRIHKSSDGNQIPDQTQSESN